MKLADADRKKLPGLLDQLARAAEELLGRPDHRGCYRTAFRVFLWHLLQQMPCPDSLIESRPPLIERRSTSGKD